MDGVLQKPDGGEMLIVLQAMAHRVFVRARGADLEAWSSAKAAFWDSAVRGSSLLRAALVRCFLSLKGLWP